jgi:hypothetical protein
MDRDGAEFTDEGAAVAEAHVGLRDSLPRFESRLQHREPFGSQMELDMRSRPSRGTTLSRRTGCASFSLSQFVIG